MHIHNLTKPGIAGIRFADQRYVIVDERLVRSAPDVKTSEFVAKVILCPAYSGEVDLGRIKQCELSRRRVKSEGCSRCDIGSETVADEVHCSAIVRKSWRKELINRGRHAMTVHFCCSFRCIGSKRTHVGGALVNPAVHENRCAWIGGLEGSGKICEQGDRRLFGFGIDHCWIPHRDKFRRARLSCLVGFKQPCCPSVCHHDDVAARKRTWGNCGECRAVPPPNPL